ncbi:MAG: hypothetical protein PHX05_08270 [Acidobacteriota bacterium]|nr:hypothetical protein [Acidobacteriota bacterium]
MIEHRLCLGAVAERCGRTKQAVSSAMGAASAPAAILDAALALGVPEDLLPPPTRTKAELRAELDRLRVENERLRESMGCDRSGEAA